jgi:hypothetical protein
VLLADDKTDAGKLAARLTVAKAQEKILAARLGRDANSLREMAGEIASRHGV